MGLHEVQGNGPILAELILIAIQDFISFHEMELPNLQVHLNFPQPLFIPVNDYTSSDCILSGIHISSLLTLSALYCLIHRLSWKTQVLY